MIAVDSLFFYLTRLSILEQKLHVQKGSTINYLFKQYTRYIIVCGVNDTGTLYEKKKCNLRADVNVLLA